MAGNSGFSKAKKTMESQASPFNVDKKELEQRINQR